MANAKKGWLQTSTHFRHFQGHFGDEFWGPLLGYFWGSKLEQSRAVDPSRLSQQTWGQECCPPTEPTRAEQAPPSAVRPPDLSSCF